MQAFLHHYRTHLARAQRGTPIPWLHSLWYQHSSVCSYLLRWLAGHSSFGLTPWSLFSIQQCPNMVNLLLYALRLCSLTDVWLIKELFSQLMPSATKSQLQSISWHSNIKIVIKFTRKWCFFKPLTVQASDTKTQLCHLSLRICPQH